jgi:hypothetical protein
MSSAPTRVMRAAIHTAMLGEAIISGKHRRRTLNVTCLLHRQAEADKFAVPTAPRPRSPNPIVLALKPSSPGMRKAASVLPTISQVHRAVAIPGNPIPAIPHSMLP